MIEPGIFLLIATAAAVTGVVRNAGTQKRLSRVKFFVFFVIYAWPFFIMTLSDLNMLFDLGEISVSRHFVDVSYI